MEITFPENFLWGAATASHQIEGSNFNSDWYDWEKKGKIFDKTSSNPGCSSENNLNRDLEMIKNMGLNSYRFSVEWAKIQPNQDNNYNRIYAEKYLNFIKRLKDLEIEPIVTLFHFSLPIWFSQKGGFEKEENIKFFTDFVQFITSYFGKNVKYYTVINEPVVYAYSSYIEGIWPPGEKDEAKGMKVLKNLLFAYDESYKIIKSVNPESMVSIAKHTAEYFPYNNYSLSDKIAAARVKRYFDHSFIDSVINKKIMAPIGHGEKYDFESGFDFLGINYYTKRYISYKKSKINVLTKEGVKTDIGWHYYPEGIEDVIKRFSKYKLPIIITENGIADQYDRYRARYIIQTLYIISRMIKEGADIRGYMHWSLMDNFEWAEGRSMRFGLYETDYGNLKFMLRNSGKVYSSIVTQNMISENIQKFIK